MPYIETISERIFGELDAAQDEISHILRDHIGDIVPDGCECVKTSLGSACRSLAIIRTFVESLKIHEEANLLGVRNVVTWPGKPVELSSTEGDES